MTRPLGCAVLLLAGALAGSAGCGKRKPAEPSAGDPAVPGGPSEDAVAAFDRKMNALGFNQFVRGGGAEPEVPVYTPDHRGLTPKGMAAVPDPGFPFGLHVIAGDLTPAALKALKPTPNLRYLYFSNQRDIGDEGLAAAARFPNLVELDASLTFPTDDGVAALKALTKLRRLDLSANGLSDAALPHLAGLTGLTHLGLGPSAVTDAGLKHLAGLRNLTVLNLSGSQVTDAGLKDLAGLRKLTALRLDSTAVTDEGVKELRAALPGCEVRR